jgi:hypothetical protein
MSEIANEAVEVDSGYYDRNRATILASLKRERFNDQEADEIFTLMKRGLTQDEAIAQYTELKHGDFVGDKSGDREDNEMSDRYADDLMEEENPIDIISVDVPLFIRMLEFAREDASTDMDLHDLAQKAIKMSGKGEPLTMMHYDELVSKEAPVTDAMSLYEKYFNA